VLSIVLAISMLGALFFALSKRTRRAIPVAARPRRESEELLAAIARLDQAHERGETHGSDYDSERTGLKARLASALAAESSVS
jgi:hypothetical protein